jgi:hypothetical protein
LLQIREDVDARHKAGHDVEAQCLSFVMAGLVPAIHVFIAANP